MSLFATARRAATGSLLAMGLVLIGAPAASAHVGVSSPDAAPGGFGKLVFRVPSESDTSRTESVTVQLPTDTPFRFVSTKAMPGWQAETATEKLDEPVITDGFQITEAVTEVTWTADRGAALAPDEFAEFELSVGPFPERADELTLPATQHYSDGEVVAWDEPAVAGQDEPEHPAPVLDLTSSATQVPASATIDGPVSGTDSVARTLGGLGFALGLVAVLAAGLSRRSRNG